MSEELLERARSDRALQEALRTSVEMAALAWEDEAGEAEDLARDARARWAGRRMADAGDEAAAALFTATTHCFELLLALLERLAADRQTDLLEVVQRFSEQPPGIGEHAGPRARELYQRHAKLLCLRVFAALGASGG